MCGVAAMGSDSVRRLQDMRRRLLQLSVTLLDVGQGLIRDKHVAEVTWLACAVEQVSSMLASVQAWLREEQGRRPRPRKRPRAPGPLHYA